MGAQENSKKISVIVDSWELGFQLSNLVCKNDKSFGTTSEEKAILNFLDQLDGPITLECEIKE